jgi:hypothetical protein
MSIEEAPFLIAHDEQLVRECGSGDVRRDGTVKPRAFMATREPLEISVHRDGYCDPSCRDRSDAAAMVVAGSVRLIASRPLVVSAPPAIDHALIALRDAPTIATKAELMIEQNAAVAERHHALCRELAAIATACDRIPRGAPIS